MPKNWNRNFFDFAENFAIKTILRVWKRIPPNDKAYSVQDMNQILMKKTDEFDFPQFYGLFPDSTKCSMRTLENTMSNLFQVATWIQNGLKTFYLKFNELDRLRWKMSFSPLLWWAREIPKIFLLSWERQ